MSPKEKMKRLGEHYKVPQGTYGIQEWSGAIKRAANKTLTGAIDMSLDVLYDRTFSKPTTGTTSSAAAPAKKDEAPAPSKDGPRGSAVVIPAQEVLRPLPANTFNLGAPALHFSLPPTTVSVPAVYDLRPAELLLQFGAYVFVFGSGVCFGILIANPVLKKLAIVVAGG